MKSLRAWMCSARLPGFAFAALLLVATLAPASVAAHAGHEHGNVIANADGDNVRLRTGPSYEDGEITRFPEGTSVDIVDGPYNAEDGSVWYQVDVDGQAGYMDSAYLVAVELPADEESGGANTGVSSGTVVTNDSVFLRTGPSTADEVVRTLAADEQVTLTGGVRDGWNSVSVTGGDGWVFAGYLDFGQEPEAPAPAPEQAGVTGTRFTIDSVNLRAGAGIEFDSLAYLDAGVQLELSGNEAFGFAEVTSSVGNGWVSAEYIGDAAPGIPAEPEASPEPDVVAEPAPETPAEPDPEPALEAVERFTTANVNLRTASSQAATVVTVVPSSTEVEFTGLTAEGFSEVRTAIGNGWISSEFLSETRPEGSAGPDPASAGSGSLITWPVSGDEWVVSQGYNGSSHQNRNGSWQYYYSLDLKRADGSTAGQPVYSAVDGTVRWIDEATGGMSIYMGDSLAYAYFHTRIDPGISEGDTITQGQYMGTIAPAGEAASGSSAHLHITVWETSDEGNWSRRAIPFTGDVAISGEEFPPTGSGNDYLGYAFNP